MKTLFLLLFSTAVMAQCQPPSIAQSNKGIIIIDQYESGLYQWFWTIGNDTVSAMKRYNSFNSQMVPRPVNGSHMWLKKHCGLNPERSAVDNMAFIRFCHQVMFDDNWVVSNVIIYQKE